jgi:hypothetical protein
MILSRASVFAAATRRFTRCPPPQILPGALAAAAPVYLMADSCLCRGCAVSADVPAVDPSGANRHCAGVARSSEPPCGAAATAAAATPILPATAPLPLGVGCVVYCVEYGRAIS